MYPEGSGNQTQANGGAPNGPRKNDNGGPTHRQVQVAHDRYFQELTQAWNEAMQEFQALQNEFSRSVEKAMQNQDIGGMQNAQFDLQRSYQDTAMSPEPRNRCLDAFRNYKQAIVQALSGADVEDLGVTDLVALSQSLAVVAQNALMVSMTTCDPSQLARNVDRRANGQQNDNR